MIGPAEKIPPIRIAGYLEKRGKMRLVVCRWKRWWFVLEGRLLLYYKSQLEYLNLSPCRGSLNMGLASGVRPGKGYELLVVTRSQTVTLRACNRMEHEQWLQSLLDAMALPSTNTFSSHPVMHFRYSSQSHHQNIIARIKNFRCPPYTTISTETTTQAETVSCETSSSSSRSSNVGQSSCKLRRVFSDSHNLLQRPCKRRRSVRLSKLALSDTSIPVISQKSLTSASSSDKCHSLQELRNSLSDNDKTLIKCKSSDDSDNVLNGSKESKLSNSIKIELNLEDVDPKNNDSMKEQKISNVKITLDGCAIYGKTEINNKVSENIENHEKYIETILDNCEVKRRSNLHLHNNKEVKSETDLYNKQSTQRHSLSCDNVQALDRSIGSTFHDGLMRVEVEGKEERISDLNDTNNSHSLLNRKSNKKRSNSILSRLLESRSDREDKEVLERQGTIKKRLSFLRKVWKKREKKSEDEDYESIDYDSIPVIELPSPPEEKAEQLLLSLERSEDHGPEPEPPPDYDISISEELDVPPMLPPRVKQRPVSPWHDIPRNNQPVLQSEPPPLPIKMRHKNPHQLLIKIIQDSSNVEQNSLSLEDSVKCGPPSRNEDQKLEDLDTLLAELSQVNTYVIQQIDISQNANGNILQVSSVPEPDYDIPRPHVSLLGSLCQKPSRENSFTPTHFLCTTPFVDTDSLDPIVTRLDAEITPDSLECDSPWSLTQPTPLYESSQSSSLLQHFISVEDKPFPDSLNT